MPLAAMPKKIAFVGDYLPRQCGIATFTSDLRNAVAEQNREAECFVVPVNDLPEGYDYPAEVRFEIEEGDIASYERAADFLHFSNTEVVCVQHEFGIYGGPAGSHVLALLRKLETPVVVTLHTILERPGADQLRVLKEIGQLASRVVVMSARGLRMAQQIYGIPAEKLDLIPHGIPDMPFVDPNYYKDLFGVEGKLVLLTFGLLAPGKGIEHTIRALPEIARQHPEVVYMVLGATHPNLVREQGETYRLGLERLAAELGVGKHVVFYNRFVDLAELKEFLGAADIFVMPYLNPEQVTSGTLAYAFGCGKAVVATPFWHAQELLADGRGVLVPFGDSAAIAREVCALIADETRRHALRKRAYLLGREMVWSQTAHLYLESFTRARLSRGALTRRRFALKTLAQSRPELPGLRLVHLAAMTDSIGVFQHAQFSLPNFREGYCTDDNARALLLAVQLAEAGEEAPGLDRMAGAYAAFVDYAFNEETGRFRNFMSFDRRWTEERGSEDSHARALWALGVCVGRSRREELRMWAANLFSRALPAVEPMTSPRAWAYILLGIHEYFRRLSGDRTVNQLREQLMLRLLGLYRDAAADDWPWFEPILGYDNAKVPHALILSGRWTGNQDAMAVGLAMLRWLVAQQTAPGGHFRPIGSNGFYPRGGTRAQFDQQPIEAHATVSACLEAFRITQDSFWHDEAHRAFDWFLGRNDIGRPLHDPRTGGCHDALHIDRVNQNMGAESTLAYLLSLVEMRQVEAALEAFNRPVEPGSHA